MLRNSILASIYFSLAGLAILRLGGILGDVIFSFGLLGMAESSLYARKIHAENKEGDILEYLSFSKLILTAENIIATKINEVWYYNDYSLWTKK